MHGKPDHIRDIVAEALLSYHREVGFVFKIHGNVEMFAEFIGNGEAGVVIIRSKADLVSVGHAVNTDGNSDKTEGCFA